MVADQHLPPPGALDPDLRLAGAFGREITLTTPDGSTPTGRPLLLVLVPFAFSPLCASEVAELAAVATSEPGLGGADVVVVSCDSPFALEAWRAELGVDVTLGSDFWPHGRLARALGAFDAERGWARRRSVLYDGAGRLAWWTESDPGHARAMGDAVAAVAGLAGAAPGSVKR